MFTLATNFEFNKQFNSLTPEIENETKLEFPFTSGHCQPTRITITHRGFHLYNPEFFLSSAISCDSYCSSKVQYPRWMVSPSAYLLWSFQRGVCVSSQIQRYCRLLKFLVSISALKSFITCTKFGTRYLQTSKVLMLL